MSEQRHDSSQRTPSDVATLCSQLDGFGRRQISQSSQPSFRSTSLHSPDPAQEELVRQGTYESVLKLVLVEYKNEARFRLPISSANNYTASLSTNTNVHKKTPSSNASLTNLDDTIPKETLQILQIYITNIATGVNAHPQLAIKDPLLKRCSLVLYAKLQAAKPLKELSSTDLIGKFMESSATEIKRFLNTDNPTVVSETMMQLSLKFMSWLIEALKLCKGTKGSIIKVQNMKNDMEENEKLKKINKGKRVSTTFGSGVNLVEQRSPSPEVRYATPNFRTTDIPSAKLLANCFGIGDVQLQQDIFRLKVLSNRNNLANDLNLIKGWLKNGDWGCTASDFEYEEDYGVWCRNMNQSIEDLTSELPPVSTNYSDYLQIIPAENTIAYSSLITQILNYESNRSYQHSASDPLITNQTQNLLALVTKYWLIPPITQTVTVLDSANKTILSEQLNINKTKSVYHWITHIRDQIPEDQPEIWNEFDKHCFIRNLILTYIYFFKSLRRVISGIFLSQQETVTKIRSCLSFYYGYLDPEPFFREFIHPTDITKKYMIKLKNTFLKASEEEYKSILDKNVPRDDTLCFDHITKLASVLYETMQTLSNRVSKLEPLLDKLGIVQTVGVLIIRCFAEDLSNIHTHIIRYSRASKQELDFNAALDCYIQCCVIRDLFVQISNDTFPYDLESHFHPYLTSLVEETCKSIIPHIDTIISNDQLEPLDLELHDKKHSSSILYLFKMLNQYVTLWDKFEYLTSAQYGEIYTKLFEAISDGLIWYVTEMRGIIIKELEFIENLKEQQQQQRSEINGKTWDLNNLKASLMKVQDKKQTKEGFVNESLNFTHKLCVALNNIEASLEHLSQLETLVDIQAIRESYTPDSMPTNITDTRKAFITVRVLKAENIKPCDEADLTSAYVALSDQSQLYSRPSLTKTSKHTLNPYYDESFEYEVNQGETLSLLVAIWNQSSTNKTKHRKEDLCGRCVLFIDTKSVPTDGTPQEFTLDLDTKEGSIFFEVSCENEIRGDIIFSMGKCHRFTERALQGCISSIVDSFGEVIYKVISREALKDAISMLQKKENVGLSETAKMKVFVDSLDPLFDYLNAQFDILANTTTTSLLFQIMEKSWNIILGQFDKLILPALASVKVLDRLRDKFKYNAKRTMYVAWANVNNNIYTPGFGTSLSDMEMNFVFIWLEQMLLFFHNDGSGPEMTVLKNRMYDSLIMAKEQYSMHPDVLIHELQKREGQYYKALRIANFLPAEEESQEDKMSRNLARTGTIMAIGRRNTLRGSFKRRATTQRKHNEAPPLPFKVDESGSPVSVEAVDEKSDQIETASKLLDKEDIILRILIAKDETSIVKKRIMERERIRRKVVTERLGRLALIQK